MPRYHRRVSVPMMELAVVATGRSRVTGGFVLSEAFMLALAPMLGRDAAHRLLYQLSLDAQACGQTFAQAVRADATISAHLAGADVDALLDLGRHTGQCAAMVDRVLAGAA